MVHLRSFDVVVVVVAVVVAVVVLVSPSVVCIEDPGCNLRKSSNLASFHEPPSIFMSIAVPRVIASLTR